MIPNAPVSFPLRSRQEIVKAEGHRKLVLFKARLIAIQPNNKPFHAAPPNYLIEPTGIGRRTSNLSWPGGSLSRYAVNTSFTEIAEGSRT